MARNFNELEKKMSAERLPASDKRVDRIIAEM